MEFIERLLNVELGLPARFIIAFVTVLVLIGLTAWIIRRISSGRGVMGAARARQQRLAVIDAAQVDSKRRLVLIRRDNTEHLLLIGGPSDVVVESQITRGPPAAERGEPRAAPRVEPPPPAAPPPRDEPAMPPRPERPAPPPQSPPSQSPAPPSPAPPSPPPQPRTVAPPRYPQAAPAAPPPAPAPEPRIAPERPAATPQSPPPQSPPPRETSNLGAGQSDPQDMARRLETALTRSSPPLRPGGEASARPAAPEPPRAPEPGRHHDDDNRNS